MERELVERAMSAKGFVNGEGSPEWDKLAEELAIAKGTMTNIRYSTYVPGARTRKQMARVLELKVEEIWPDGPVVGSR